MTFWCAVQTHARSEDKAAFHLRRQGYEVYLPKHLKTRRHARRVDWVPSPLFPRYLFVLIDPTAMPCWSIRSTVGVSALVSFGQKPAAVPEEIIHEIRVRQDENGLVKINEVEKFKPGQAIRVADGPFTDVEGLFECPSDDDRVNILLKIMGRTVRVRLPVDTIYASA